MRGMAGTKQGLKGKGIKKKGGMELMRSNFFLFVLFSFSFLFLSLFLFQFQFLSFSFLFQFVISLVSYSPFFILLLLFSCRYFFVYLFYFILLLFLFTPSCITRNLPAAAVVHQLPSLQIFMFLGICFTYLFLCSLFLVFLLVLLILHLLFMFLFRFLLFLLLLLIPLLPLASSCLVFHINVSSLWISRLVPFVFPVIQEFITASLGDLCELWVLGGAGLDEGQLEGKKRDGLGRGLEGRRNEGKRKRKREGHLLLYLDTPR